MPVAGGGFEQCYNAQAAVDAETMLVLATGVTQAVNDKQQIAPMMTALNALPEELGEVVRVLADAGYFSAANLTACIPVFGIIKAVMGFQQFLLRGLHAVRGEWSLVTMAWNIRRMGALRALASG